MKKVIALLLTFAMAICVFAGCSKLSGEKTETTTTEKATEEAEETPREFPDEIKAEKVGTVNLGEFEVVGNGIIYNDSTGKAGIMSFDGKSDTGAKYAVCRAAEQYFCVSSSDGKNATNDDLKTVNVFGIVDVNGKELVPQQYAAFDVLNDRYIKACKATGIAANDEECTFYQEDMYYVFGSIQEDDLMYKGEWCIYDTVTGKPIEGLTGENNDSMRACGKYIGYVNAEGDSVIVDNTGAVTEKTVFFLDDDNYAVVDGDNGTVYNKEDKKVFSYSTLDYTIEYYLDNDYYSGLTPAGKYVVVDNTGKVVSSEFDENFNLDGTVIEYKQQLFDFKGNNIIDGKYQSVYYDFGFRNVFLIGGEKPSTIIKADGTVIYQSKEGDKAEIDPANFAVYQEKNDKRKFYSFKDKNFTINADYSITPFLVTSSNGGKSNVIDTISGKTIIEGYDDYNTASFFDVAHYIYAMKQSGNGLNEWTVDIYEIK